MITYLFDQFDVSESVYDAAESYWEALVQECADEVAQTGEWRRWWPKSYGDGKTPMDPGFRPIFDVMNDRQKKAITIAQRRPSKEELELVPWLRELGYKGCGEFAGVVELAIDLAASEESVLVARKLIVRWMNDDTGVSEMKKAIDELGRCYPASDGD